MRYWWQKLSSDEREQATAELIQRLRQNPEALELLNDILGVWLDSGAQEDFDHFLSNLMLEVEAEEAPASTDSYLPPLPGFLH